MKEQILQLRQQGKTYNEIKEQLGCSKGTIAYHCGEGQKEKSLTRRRINKDSNPYQNKIDKFKSRVRDFQRHRDNSGNFLESRNYDFTYEDVVQKLTLEPICYLTGKPIDILDTKSYHFDHIVPITKGGDYSLENLAICTKEANIAKSNLSKEELLELCKDILTYNGYTIT